MSSILEEDLGFLHRKLIRGKDKNETFLKQREFYLDVKKQDLTMSAQQQTDIDAGKPPEAYNSISSDIWYQISRYVPPEDVQRFAMICKETASLTRTKAFWKNLFKKYCLKFGTKIWILQLPAHLQFHSICDYNPQLFRARVIEALFYCYIPLVARINRYTLDLLIGKDYISAWHKLWENCMWIMCYQFRQHGIPQRNITRTVNRYEELHAAKLQSAEIVNDWESLAVSDDNDNIVLSNNDENQLHSTEEINPYEGVCLLVIYGHRFIPFPKQLTYSRGDQAACLRLAATRRPLTSDMREYNLELDFVDTINKAMTTVKYPTVKHKVLPWWHPDFEKYVKYEACDKFS